MSNIKHPEALTTVLQPAVMAGLNKVNFSLLKDIPLVGELGELVKNSSTTLGHFVGVVDNISTGANYVSAWIGMGECRKKQERLIELREELKSITDPIKYNKKISEIDNLNKDYENELVESGCNLIESIAGVVSKIPLIGQAYGGIISGSSTLLKNASNMIIQHNKELDKYISMLNGGVSKYEVSKQLKSLDGFANNYKTLQSLKASGIMNIMSESEKSRFQDMLNNAETEFAKAREKMEEINRELEKIGNRRRNGETPDTPFGFTPDGDLKGPNKGREGANQPYDPLVVDLKNDGFEILGLKDGTHFDLDGDKLKEKTSWTSKSDGFLSIDLDGNGRIESGAELFGDSFLLADGTYAKSAIEALASLDKNKDGVIDAKDDVYSKLRIWNDANGNGISEAEELKSLADYNITSINVADIKDENKDINGSRLRRTISFERQEKIVEDNVEKTIRTTGKIGEFLLQRDGMDTIDEDLLSMVKDDPNSQAIIDRIKKLPNIRSFGKVRSLYNEMFLDKSGELLSLVEKFVNTKDIAEKDEILDKILIKMGKAEGTSDTQSGQYINGKYVKVLESFFGQDLEKGSLSQRRADFYRASYGDFKHLFFAKLTLNTEFKNVESLFDIKNNRLANMDLLNRYVRLGMTNDNANNIFDSASRVLMYLESIGIQGFDEFKEYFANISSSYIDRIAKSNFKIYKGTNVAENLYSYSEGVTISAGDGDDYISGTFNSKSGNDYFYGGKGNDRISGGKGSDTYIFNLGDGQDIIEESANENDKNIISFGSGILKEDIILKRINEKDLEISIKGTDDKITVRNQFDKFSAINNIYFNNGESLTDSQIRDILNQVTDGNDFIEGTDKDDNINLLGGDDILFARGGNDTITGGRGNDTINAGTGNNTIIYNLGDGNDVISANYYGHNKIQFGEGIKKEDIIIARTNGSDITIGFKNNPGTIKIKGQYGSGIIEMLNFFDGSSMNYDQMKKMSENTTPLDDYFTGTSKDDYIEGGAGNDYLNGGAGNDTYVFGRGDGVDTISESGGSEKDNKDTILFKEGIKREDIEFERVGSSDVEIRIKGTQDKIILKNLFDKANGVEQLQFSDGSIYKLEDIKEELAVIRGTDNKDSLSAFSGENYKIYAGGGDDVISGYSGNDKLYGQEGNDTIYGGNGNDYIEGGVGNDYLNGGAGNDTYVFSKGDGKDTIYDQDSNPNNKDRIQLGYDILNTIFKRDGSNLCIGFADSTDTITINNWYSGSSYQIEEIKSSDNRSITNVQLQLMIDAMAAYTKEKGIDWNTAVKQNPNEVNSILQNFWVSNSN